MAVKELASITKELADLKNDLNQAEDRMQTRLCNWLDAVEMVTGRLNVSFNAYMKKLQYQGKVPLLLFQSFDFNVIHPCFLLPQVSMEKLGTVDEYEMQMSVSFRENAALAPLSGHKHSGGERAVSTIMFLMALQVAP